LPESSWDLRELRLLAQRRGSLFRLCKLMFTKRDASIYVVPYARAQRYFSGSSEIAEHEVSSFLNAAEGIESDREPKLSIHESGQVHVHAAGARAGVVQSLPLAGFRGEHLATVCFDKFDGLPPYVGPVRTAGPEREFVFVVPDDVPSGRLAMYANAAEPKFARGQCLMTFTLVRPTLARPLFIGLHPISQAALGEPDRSGVTVIAGWDPATNATEALRYVYLRG
jgi:hypothetical protein